MLTKSRLKSSLDRCSVRLAAIRFLFVVGAAYIYSGSNNKRESPTKMSQNKKNGICMNNHFRYQLETPKVTGRRQQKFTCPHCGKLKCLVRYVDTQNGCNYVADHVGTSSSSPTAVATRSGPTRCNSPPASTTTSRLVSNPFHPTPTLPTCCSIPHRAAHALPLR